MDLATAVRLCSVEDCEAPHLARGFCRLHYKRWAKHGDPNHVVVPATECAVEDCDKPPHGHGWCETHYRRWKKHGDTVTVLPPGRPAGPGHHNWVGDQISYRGIHDRLRRRRGNPSLYSCETCGVSPARDWSYDHADPDELVSDEGFPYSLDLARYKPLCKPCHNAIDHPRQRTA